MLMPDKTSWSLLYVKYKPPFNRNLVKERMLGIAIYLLLL